MSAPLPIQSDTEAAALSDTELDYSPPLKPLSRSASHSQPRGILKNHQSQSQSQSTRQPAQALVWDEANLSLNEVQKDSTMKITEPKTPYVRYDAETDTVMDLDKIPGFELGLGTSEDIAMSPPPSASLDGVGGTGTGTGTGSRRGSEASEKMVKVEAPLSSSGGEEGEESDEEGWDEETRQHRRQFAQKRGGHYRNEAEAMKRAAALLAAEDEGEDSEGGNGGGAGGGDGVPPVPKVPNGLQ